MKRILLYRDNPPKQNFILSEPSVPKEDRVSSQISPHIEENLEKVKKIFSADINGDVVIREFGIGFNNAVVRAFIVCVDGLTSSSSINDFVLEPLMNSANDLCPSIEKSIEYALVPQIQMTASKDICSSLDSVNIGNAVLFAEGSRVCFVLDVKSWEHRGISNPENEAVIQGPHEGFNEVLRCNTALIRKSLGTANLIMENVSLGKTSKTPGAVAYLKNVTNDSLVKEVKRRINSIDAEYVLSSLDVEQYIEEDTFLPVPQMITTERPDRVCKALTEGRVALVLNGSSHVLIMPATFFDLVTSAEDGYLRYPYSMLIRFLRYVAVVLALLLPGVFAAILNFHPQLLLTNILLAVSSSRALVPYGALVELLIMETAFELIKEAGIRIPGPIGSTLGIVGGLIVGQAAVEANLVSPIMIIIVAVTGIASFTVPSYSLSFAFRFSRFLYIFAGAFAGLYGVVAVFFVNTLLAFGTKSFGVPFMSPLSPIDARNIFSVVFGSPIWRRGTVRERYLRPKDMFKKSHISRKWKE